MFTEPMWQLIQLLIASLILMQYFKHNEIIRKYLNIFYLIIIAGIVFTFEINIIVILLMFAFVGLLLLNRTMDYD